MDIRATMTGTTTGHTPNLYWNAVNTDKLRVHPKYIALPPVSDITLDTIESYRSSSGPICCSLRLLNRFLCKELPKKAACDHANSRVLRFKGGEFPRRAEK